MKSPTIHQLITARAKDYTPRQPASLAAAKEYLGSLPAAPENEQAALCEFVGFIYEHSPFLFGIVQREPAFFLDILHTDPDEVFSQLMQELEALPLKDQAVLMRDMRLLKRRVALLTGALDILDGWSLQQVTQHLSDFADATIRKSLLHILLQQQDKKLITLPVPDSLEGSGVAIFALGKLGSRELNYSSDIDIMLLFDANWGGYEGKQSLAYFWIKVTQELTTLLQQRTQDGYVFRVDLRLRPDPSSTPAAVSIQNAENYYETVGQNWERAAMIKARFCAGDADVAAHFTRFIHRFVWRKYLDFASIQDIHSIKRQIDVQNPSDDETLRGFNVKLGHGGIREIEFYAQTQQLIWGGKQAELQRQDTLSALEALRVAGKITAQAEKELQEAYRFLRDVEHRLQMVNDYQTHSIPDNDAELELLASFLHFASVDAFLVQLRATISIVTAHYGRLFDHSPSLASTDPRIKGSLVFTGVDHDPETLITLRKLGYEQPEAISLIIRNWHHGKRRATRTKRARELLTELMPTLLYSFAETISPDRAFKYFDEFLGRLPAGVQLFSLIYANPDTLKLLATILGAYTFVSEHLSKKPALMEYVLADNFFQAIESAETLRENLHKRTLSLVNYEDQLDAVRQWKNELQFRIGIQFIQQRCDAVQASGHLTRMADAALEKLFTATWDDFVAHNQRREICPLAVIALGKLGSQELTFGSDIDIVFVADTTTQPDKDAMNETLRLARRYVTAITSLTKEGKLFDVDMRLRPGGKDGALVTSLSGFEHYYQKDAWANEYIALSRARVLTASSPGLFASTEACLRTCLGFFPRHERERPYIDEIRQKMHKQFGTGNPLDVKYAPGGLIDCELVVQYLQLTNQHKDFPVSANVLQAVELLKNRKILDKKRASQLAEALRYQTTLQCILRLIGIIKVETHDNACAIKEVICSHMQAKTYEEFKKTLVEHQENVQKMYSEIFG